MTTQEDLQTALAECARLRARVATMRDGIRVAAVMLESVYDEQAPNMALSYLALGLMGDPDGVARRTSEANGIDAMPEWPLTDKVK